MFPHLSRHMVQAAHIKLCCGSSTFLPFVWAYKARSLTYLSHLSTSSSRFLSSRMFQLRPAFALIALRLCPIFALTNPGTDAQTLFCSKRIFIWVSLHVYEAPCSWSHWVAALFSVMPPFELASLSLSQFSTISHSAFPGRSARIKKSNFCDGNVTFVSHYSSNCCLMLIWFVEHTRDTSIPALAIYSSISSRVGMILLTMTSYFGQMEVCSHLSRILFKFLGTHWIPCFNHKDQDHPRL